MGEAKRRKISDTTWGIKKPENQIFIAVFECELDGVIDKGRSMNDEEICDDELKMMGFETIYEKKMGKCMEWLGDEGGAINSSQLEGETLEAFNRMKFKVISRSTENR